MSNNGRLNLFDYVNKRETDSIAYAFDDLQEESLYSNLYCSNVLKAHVGCVNALDWSGDGELLASGSDDTKFCIWSMSKGRRLIKVYSTAHSENIFGIKFLPTRTDQLVTAAKDGRVQLHALDESGEEISTRTWRVHLDSVKRIDTELGNPHLFMTCSEDGTIRQFDSRTDEHPLLIADWSFQQIALNSLCISQVKPWYLACGGTGPIVRIIDRRMLSNLMTPIDDDTSLLQPYLYDRVWMPIQKTSVEMVTSLKFRKKSMDLIASFIGDNIHLVNFEAIRSNSIITSSLSPSSSSSSPSPPSLYLQQEETFYDKVYKKWRECQYKDFFAAISQRIGQHQSLQYHTIRNLVSIFAYELHARMLCAVQLDRMVEAYKDADELMEFDELFDQNTLQSIFDIFALSAEHYEKCDDLLTVHIDLEDTRPACDEDRTDLKVRIKNYNPIIIPETEEWKNLQRQSSVCFSSSHQFHGHVNMQTVKDVGFAGLNEEFIVSGSDGGFFFVWNNNGEIIFIGQSDTYVVNCVVQHPKLPLLAISGIDNDIKLWEPGVWDTFDLEEGRNNNEANSAWKAVPIDQRSNLLERLRTMDGSSLPSLAVPCHVQ